jgi:hypothetical protein
MKRGRFSKFRQKAYSSEAGFWMAKDSTTWMPRSKYSSGRAGSRAVLTPRRP